MLRTRWMLRVAVIAAAMWSSPLRADAADDTGKDVVVATPDGMKLAATWWDGPEPGAAGVVLVHMHGGNRAEWNALVPHLRRRGLEVLAVDLRGHGGSVKQSKGGNLAARVARRDAALFEQMHLDAIAGGRWLVKQGKCGPKRIALVGADVGASIAVDTARRYPNETAAVACLSPGTSHAGLATLEHVKTWPADAPLLVAVHRAELDAGAQAIRDAVPTSRQVVYDEAAPAAASADGAQWAHGTRMLGRIPLVEQTVASFVAAQTGSKADDVLLDGVIDDEAAEGGAWRQTATIVKTKDIEGWGYRVGRRVQFGGRVKGKPASVFLGVATHFAPGTAPGLSTDPDDGFPEIAAIDLAKGAFAWAQYLGDGAPPGVKVAQDRGRPAVRVVPTADGFTFEGEWITEYGDGPKGPVDPEKVRMAMEVRSPVPESPKKGAGFVMIETSWQSDAVVLTAR